MDTRLKQFLAAENITQAQFADSINIVRASVSHILNKRNKPGYEFIVNTMKRYPDLNMEWLLTGKGKMYKSADSQPRQNANAHTDAPTYEDDTLFGIPEDDGLFASREQDISTPVLQDGANNGFLEGTGSPSIDEKTSEPPVRQRKATKIIVFYDDCTFQEF